MSSSSVLNVFSLEVHYGAKKEKTFINLLEDNFIETIINTGEKTIRKRLNFLEDLELAEVNSKKYFKGKFTRSLDFWTDRILSDKGEKIDSEEEINSLPHANFYIDLVNHRIFWARSRSAFGAPTIKNFCSFLKHIIHSCLREKYYSEAQVEYEKYRDHFKGNNKLNKHSFIGKWFKDAGYDFNGISILPQAIVDESTVEKIINTKANKIKKIKLDLSVSNAKKRNMQGLGRDLDGLINKLSDSMDSKADVTISPEEGKYITNKGEAIKLSKLQNKNRNVGVSYYLDNDDPTKKNRVLTTNPTTGKNETDLRYTKNYSCDSEDICYNEISNVNDEFSRYDVKGREKTSNLIILSDFMEKINNDYDEFINNEPLE